MEPDHSYAIAQVLHNYPNCKVVTSAMAAGMIQQFFGYDERAPRHRDRG